MSLKIIKVRICRNCGDVLAQNCDKCKKHPDRTPKIETRYEAPPILEKCAAGNCVKVACQVSPELRPNDCKRTSWKKFTDVTRPRRFSELFCSQHCSSVMTGVKRQTGKIVSCDNPKCDRGKDRTRNKFKVIPADLARHETHYCCSSCYHISRKVKDYERIEAEKRKQDDFTTQMLVCYSAKCRGAAQEHTQVSGNSYRCTCGQIRNAQVKIKANWALQTSMSA